MCPEHFCHVTPLARVSELSWLSIMPQALTSRLHSGALAVLLLSPCSTTVDHAHPSAGLTPMVQPRARLGSGGLPSCLRLRLAGCMAEHWLSYR